MSIERRCPIRALSIFWEEFVAEICLLKGVFIIEDVSVVERCQLKEGVLLGRSPFFGRNLLQRYVY